jgi:predicted transposase/invertase (TIGR01784 family)
MQQGHDHPPIVIPLLFCRGSKSPYPGSLDIFDCFEDPAFAREDFLIAHLLVDISVIPDEELKTHTQVALLELLEKHISIRDLIELLPYLVDEVLRQYLMPEQFKSVINYIQRAGHSKDYSTFIALFRQHVLTAEYKNIMQTFADYLRQEGRQEGMQLGAYEAKRQDAKKMLMKGIEYSIVKETQVSQRLN